MKKKILKILIVFLIIMTTIGIVYSKSARDLVKKEFSELLGEKFGELDSGVLLDGDQGVICVHYDGWEDDGRSHFHSGYVSGYHYTDRILINSDGKNPWKLEYSGIKKKDGKDKSTSQTINGKDEGYPETIAHLARLFYEGRTDLVTANGGWDILHEYRAFCKYYMNSDLKSDLTKRKFQVVCG